MKSFNLFDGELDDERTEPAGFTWRAARLGPKLGGDEARRERLRAPARRALVSLPLRVRRARNGSSSSPARPTLRVPDGEHELRAGRRRLLPRRARGRSSGPQRHGRADPGPDRLDEAAAGRSRLSGQRQDRDLDRATTPIRPGSSGSASAVDYWDGEGLETATTPLAAGSSLRRYRAASAAVAARGRTERMVGRAAVGGHPRSRVGRPRRV